MLWLQRARPAARWVQGWWKGPALWSRSDRVTLFAVAWPAEAGHLEQSLRDVTERWQRELQQRRRLQEALAVGDPPPNPDSRGSVGGGPCAPWAAACPVLRLLCRGQGWGPPGQAGRRGGRR